MKMKVKTFEGTFKAKLEDLNVLSIVFRDAANYNNANGYEGLGEAYQKASDEIFKALDEAGFYDDIRNKKEVQ